jgi:oxygen-independent coproporphyrinogen-3 oxidase
MYKAAHILYCKDGINNMMDYSIYLHIPFCKHRCHYCDFNTYAEKESLISPYIKALINEIRIVCREKSPINIHSIYFGGGTPSIIPIALYKNILSTIRSEFNLTNTCEISLEANPGTLDLDYLYGLRDLGFNRISIGVQSTNPCDLKRLDRIHNVNDVLRSVYYAKKAGLSNINLDLIFGLPGQSLADWEHSLSRAIYLNPNHFSLYSLQIEPGTVLYRWYQRGLIPLQDQDLEGDMYELAMEKLNNAGYQHYEISNWAKFEPGTNSQCRHNLQYWRNLPYFGFGAGAHGYINNIRTENISGIEDYIQRLDQENNQTQQFTISPAAISSTVIDNTTQMKDFMMLGFRLIQEGVSEERFKSEFQSSMKKSFDFEIQALLEKGLIEWGDEHGSYLRLSKRGIFVANQVFMAFV